MLDGAPITATALMVIGSITEVEDDDAELRAMVGFGAGQAKVKGQFEVRDATDAILLRFESHGATYSGIGVLGLYVSGLISGLINRLTVTDISTVVTSLSTKGLSRRLLNLDECGGRSFIATVTVLSLCDHRIRGNWGVPPIAAPLTIVDREPILAVAR